MIRIRSIPLRRHLHLLFSSLFLLAASTIGALAYRRADNALDRREAETLRSEIGLLSLPARRALEQGRNGDLAVLIASLATRPATDLIAISDEHGRILQASRYALNGRPIETALPEARGLRAPTDRTIRIRPTAGGYIAASGIDYVRGGQTLREPHRAVIWIRDDLRFERRRILFQALHDASLLLVLGLLGTLLLMYLTKRYIATPLYQLETLARRIGEGDYDPPLEISGSGESANLARHLQRLGRTIATRVEQLREQREELSVTLDSIGDAVIATDAQGYVTRMNPVAEALTGWPIEEARGRPLKEVFDIVHASTREPAPSPVERVLHEGVIVGLANHTALIARGGAEYQIADSAAPIRTADGRVLGVIMVFQDVTAEYATQQHLSDTHARLDSLVQALPDLVFVFSADGEYLEVFGGDAKLLARDRDELLGRRIPEILPRDPARKLMKIIAKTVNTGQRQQIDYSLDLPVGRRHFEGRTALLDDPEAPRVIFLARDITRRRTAEENARKLAHFDPLTGLPNRNLLETRLRQAVARAQRDDRYGALIFIDLDDFKHINDSLGHAHGDKVLSRLAGRLRAILREEDMICRFGGDEFLVLLEQLDGDMIQASGYAETIARKLRDASARPIEIDDHRLRLSLSIGITLFPDRETPLEQLIQRADIAMYRAKETGRGRVCFFSSDLQQAAEDRLRVQQELRDALDHNELTLQVQPMVDAGGNWLGGEVLLRWRHPREGLLSPDAFIPIAEQSGLITALDDWVIAQVIQRLAAEHPPGLPERFQGLAINLSCPTLTQPGFLDRLRRRLDDNHLGGGCLELEITERLLVDDYAHTAEVMHAARELGLRFSIDDFGTGCSTLRYLQRLPLDRIKIDRSFITHLPTRRNDAVLVETIIDLARHLGLETVAEGVENTAQQAFLVEHGCTSFQGWLFAQPMPWEEFFTRLKTGA